MRTYLTPIAMGLAAVAAPLAAPGGAGAAWGPAACPPLPAPSGPMTRVGPERAADLPAIVARAASGTTVLLEDGRYRLAGSLVLARPGVALRSASGRPAAVVLDGGYSVRELVVIRASGVTVAELTLQRAANHLVHAAPWEGDRTFAGTRLHRLRLLDAGEQMVKVNPNGARTAFAHRGRLECSELRLTAVGRPRVRSDFLPCYTGGIDAHGARGWAVRLNRVQGIWCPNGLAEHAVHFWSGSAGTLVERNLVVDCARGIGFGLGDRGHSGGVVRGNVVVARRPVMDTGIGLESARDARVLHNTVWVAPAARTRLFSGIDVRFGSTTGVVQGNLAQRVSVRDGAAARIRGNVEDAPASWFANPAGLDLHLTPAATGARDRGAPVAGAGPDIDGERRDASRPDIGADESS